MILISRYTETGDYPALAETLKASCQRFELFHDVRPAPDVGSWEGVVNRKPNWIMETLLNNRQAVLWVDVDCEIMRLPTLLLGPSADFAVYNFAADADNRCCIGFDPTKLVCANGVMYFGYTAPAIELLIRWISFLNQEPDKSRTDCVFDQAFNVCRPPVTWLWLPQSYNRMDTIWPEVTPVINHVYREGAFRYARSA